MAKDKIKSYQRKETQKYWIFRNNEDDVFFIQTLAPTLLGAKKLAEEKMPLEWDKFNDSGASSGYSFCLIEFRIIAGS